MEKYSLRKPNTIPVTRTALEPMGEWGQWMHVMQSTLERVHDKKLFHWEVLAKKPAVVVLPITQEGEMILIDQFRYPLMDWELECPAETMDQIGDTPEIAAIRALQEEIGYRCRQLIQVATYASSGGTMDELAYGFIATDCVPLDSGHNRSTDEIIRVNHVPISEVENFLASRVWDGQILNPKMDSLIGRYVRSKIFAL